MARVTTSPITIRARNPITQTSQGLPNPYYAENVLGSEPNWKTINGIPWDKLEFLPMNYGKP